MQRKKVVRRTTICVDWDDTLVDVKTKQWLPDASLALRNLLATNKVIIHSCRASWPEGLAEITTALHEASLWPHPFLSIVAKPNADVYVDDKALRFEGDWGSTLGGIRGLLLQAGDR